MCSVYFTVFVCNYISLTVCVDIAYSRLYFLISEFKNLYYLLSNYYIKKLNYINYIRTLRYR